jgi:hypothetical protein
MFPSDPTFNELHIREKQLLLGDTLLWMNQMAQEEDDIRYQNEIINRVIDLIEIDRVMNYFIDFERSSNRFLNEARLQNARLKHENQELKEVITNLQNALDNAASNI